MEIAQGTVSNCQHTLKVSGAANNTSTSTTYIALFRVNGRPVEFRSSSPSSLSDGDQVIAAGPLYRGAINALACRNSTTGEMMNAGLWGYLIGAAVVLCVGVFFCVMWETHWSTALPLVIVAVITVAATAYLVHRVILTRRAIAAVGG